MKRLVDTNVLEVANDLQAERYSPACILAATRLLRDVQQRGHILLDAGFEILREYMRHANEGGQPGVGDAFLKWAKSNEYTVAVCTRVPITPHPDREYEEFPDAEDLAAFDRSDRKFVAVALAHGEEPPIYNATDTDWHEHWEALTRHGVRVEFLCPTLMPQT